MASTKVQETGSLPPTKLHNVYQKLQQARVEFLNASVKKSGKNMHMEFKYFELSDIVPVATEIFSRLGLLAVPNIGGSFAIMKVFDTDNPDAEHIPIEAPFVLMPPIQSKQGVAVTNEMQALGSSLTYIRRYLWMLTLDIIEADTFDAISGSSDTPAPKPKKASAPATASERKAVKEELTSPEAPASELQITALKQALKLLLETDAEQEEFVQGIVVKTDSFTKLSKEQAEALVVHLGEMIAAYGKEGK